MICPMLGAAYTLADAAIVIAASKMLKYFPFIKNAFLSVFLYWLCSYLQLLYNKAVENSSLSYFFIK